MSSQETSRFRTLYDSWEFMHGADFFDFVYKVRKISDGKEYCIKEVLVNDEDSKPYREERANRLLEHQNLVKCYDLWEEEVDYNSHRQVIKETNGPVSSTDLSAKTASSGAVPAFAEEGPNLSRVLYIEMELMDMDLAGFLSKNKERNHLMMVNMFEQIIQGLEYLHDKAIIHRDLKPRNILIRNNNGKMEVKISDFGSVTQHLGGEEAIVTTGKDKHTKDHGTQFWRAPEQINHTDYNIQADLYPVGLIYLSMITTSEEFSEWERTKIFPECVTEVERQFILSQISLKPEERKNCKEMLDRM